MKNAILQLPSGLDQKKILDEIERKCVAEWNQVAAYYQKRKAILFISCYRYWEKQRQPQSSLAVAAAKQGIPSVWREGLGWDRDVVDTEGFESKIVVRALPGIPGDRFSLIHDLNIKMQAHLIGREIERLGGNPIIWVHGGMDEGLAKLLPYVDVYSVFDDLFRQRIEDPLCRKSALITTQNAFAFDRFKSTEKCQIHLPPVTMPRESQPSPFHAPSGFPKRRMGYFGSLFPTYFNFDLFEVFLSRLSDWGFILAGRTDSAGMEIIRKLRGKYPNFYYMGWRPKAELESAWVSVSVTLLLYRPSRPEQQGSFVSKILESLYYGVPCIGTGDPKTEMISPYFPLTNNPNELITRALEVSEWPRERLREPLAHYLYEMNPLHQLSKVASWLEKKTR